MARHRTLTDEDILDRARPLLLTRGEQAKCRDLSAAVGLTWGAIALRFGSKRGLFLRAMRPTAPAAPARADSLDSWLRTLCSQVIAEWPRHLQLRLSQAQPPQADITAMAAALRRHAELGEVRADYPPPALARLILITLTGVAAQGFVQSAPTAPADDGVIDMLRQLLAPPGTQGPTPT